MPSSRRPTARTRTRSLRQKILIAVSSVAVLITLSISVISLVALQASLIDQVDARLTKYSGMPGPPSTHFRENDTAPNQNNAPESTQDEVSKILMRPGTGIGTIAAYQQGNDTSAGRLESSSEISVLDVEQFTSALQQPRNTIQTLTLTGSNDRYRVITTPTRNGVELVGLPLEPALATLWQVGTTIAIVAVLGITLIILTTAAYIKHAMKPLEHVAEAASQVTGMRLDKGQVSLRDKVTFPEQASSTEVAHVTEAFNEMLDHIERSLAARDLTEHKIRQFIADISHELRTPLASIRGYSELTRRISNELSDDTVYAMERIESESIRMSYLVEDLLLLARLDEGRELQLDEVDLVPLVVDSTHDARVTAPDHHWKVIVPQKPLLVSGDQVKLQQVIVNVLANAHKHTPADTTVTVQLTKTPEQAILRIQDDGPGIPEKIQETLFDRFTRGDSSRHRGNGSTGLGLAIVKAIVSAHHGTVAVESNPQVTVFTITLPRLTAAMDPSEADTP